MADQVLLDGESVRRAVRRMAHEFSEKHPQGNFALVGIQTRGVPLAHRLAKEFQQIEGGKTLAVGSLDISFHRDDLASNMPVPKGSEVLFDLKDRTIILVDDVARYFARDDAFAVLVDRGHRELPIRPDFVGKNLPTSAQQRVRVRLAEMDGEDAVVLEKEKV